MQRLMAFLVVFAAVCRGQGTTVNSISLSNGIHLQIESQLGRPTPQQVISADMAPASGNSFYRIFRDQNGLAIYAYELMLERLSSQTEFRLTVKPAGTGLERVFPRANGGKPTPTMSASRQLATLHPGDRVEIPVFERAGTGQQVVDEIELRLDSAPPPARSGDALRFAGLQVSVNGNPVSSGNSKAVVSGRYAMFYLPGRGGYFFAMDAPAGRGFMKAGWIDGTRMEFVLENQNFQCMAEVPILVGAEAGVGRAQVWVYHDPAYQPEGNWTRPLDSPTGIRGSLVFFAAAGDSLHWWLR